jgi:hypothetical protein
LVGDTEVVVNGFDDVYVATAAASLGVMSSGEHLRSRARASVRYDYYAGLYTWGK